MASAHTACSFASGVRNRFVRVPTLGDRAERLGRRSMNQLVLTIAFRLRCPRGDPLQGEVVSLVTESGVTTVRFDVHAECRMAPHQVDDVIYGLPTRQMDTAACRPHAGPEASDAQDAHRAHALEGSFCT